MRIETQRVETCIGYYTAYKSRINISVIMGIVQALMDKRNELLAVPVSSEASPCVPCYEKVDRKPGNPSSFEDLHAKTKELYPQNFEGAYLLLKKPLSQHFNITYK